MNKQLGSKWVLVCLSLLFQAGCLNMGPSTIARDRFDYAAALSESWKGQLLLNIVKIRYADAPIFLDVASITNQYALERQVDLNFLWVDGIAGDSHGIGGSGKYTDRPTITYYPVMGSKFKSSMLRPIPPEELLNLIQSGWDVDFAFRLCVQAINGINNRVGKLVNFQPAETEFYILLELLAIIQQSGGLGVRVVTEENGATLRVSLSRKKSGPVAQEIEKVKVLLGLDSESWEFSLSYGAIQTDPNDIAILTRSMLQILVEMATYIDVPKEHVVEKRVVGQNSLKRQDSGTDHKSLMRINSFHAKPEDTFVSVNYRDYWFWIDDRDFLSKRTFSFLMFLFSLAETGAPERAPVLTIPAG